MLIRTILASNANELEFIAKITKVAESKTLNYTEQRKRCISGKNSSNFKESQGDLRNNDSTNSYPNDHNLNATNLCQSLVKPISKDTQKILQSKFTSERSRDTQKFQPQNLSPQKSLLKCQLMQENDTDSSFPSRLSISKSTFTKPIKKNSIEGENKTTLQSNEKKVKVVPVPTIQFKLPTIKSI